MSPSVSPRRSKPRPLPSQPTDPFTLALLPPADETSSQKQSRLLREKQAKQRSDEIDALLKQQPPIEKKGRVYKMVLLGQAGAGKTTVLKQMRLLYDPEAHERERRGWRRIVLLNLVASVRVMLVTLKRWEGEWGMGEAAKGEEVGPKSEVNEASADSRPWMEHIDEVVRLERELRSELGAFGEEVVLTDSDNTAPSPSELDHQCRQVEQQSRTKNSSDKSPLLLRPGWQERLFSYARRSFSHSSRDPSHADSHDENDADHDTLTLLRTLQPTILSLWNDDSRCRTLRCRNLFLDSQADAATTYFLDALPRIVSPSYSPTDEDILHSRVRTVGITESTFRVDRTLSYRIYDVDGSRSQRAAWASFLDDVDSIIFLAPLSAFDQPLVEDPSVNRLADTFSLFSQIVANPLLRHASVILFLNKIDLLEKKLKAGVRLARYWDYDGDNDFEAVWRWFRGRFRDCLREQEGGAGRRLYVHTTVATSTRQIRAILMSVKDNVLRENLRVTGLVG